GDEGPAGRHVPVVGLEEVVMHAPKHAGSGIGTVGLHHLRAAGDPAPSKRLDEATALVRMSLQANDENPFDTLAFLQIRHGARVYRSARGPERAARAVCRPY